MTTSGGAFKKRLRSAGISASAIDAAWPEWWSDAADASVSARAELHFSIARKLGLDPKSLVDGDEVRFIWDDSAKYKNFDGTSEERAAIAAFGTAVAKLLLKASPENAGTIEGLPAQKLRKALLARGRPFIELRDLMALAWGIGIPVIHLRVFPLPAKRMCAMTVRVGDRFAILLARDSDFPATTAFHLAHEFGHIALAHLENGSAVIDMKDPSDRDASKDPEEEGADTYALEVLTGDANPQIVIDGKGKNSSELAARVIEAGPRYKIEPGTLALCYGYQTGNWKTTFGAFTSIYAQPRPVWEQVNRLAISQLSLSDLTDDSASYLRALMGGLT